jgi:predicted TIM-barrel fold metal-dependent hydrolase
MDNGAKFATGQELTQKHFALVLNHPLAMVRDLPEEFLVFGEFKFDLSWTGTALRELGRMPLRDFSEKDGHAYCECTLTWIKGQEPDRIQLFYRSLEKGASHSPVAATHLLPRPFWSAAWSPRRLSDEQAHKDAQSGKYWVGSPMSNPGRWQLAHPFCTLDDIAVIYLWRYEAPAFFEMHSHVQSNHCSPFPPAWVHTWDNSTEFMHVEPGYHKQDRIMPIVMGEMGEITVRRTAEIAGQFLNDFPKARYQSVFPFLAMGADQISCLMPMDLEYMHFNGYFGIPISMKFFAQRTDSRVAENARWYCWNRLWYATTNNRYGFDEAPPRYMDAPIPSENREVWCWMDESDSNHYEDWSKQRDAYARLSKPHGDEKRIRTLPFFHFDPRRYTPQAASFNDSGNDLDGVLARPIQSPLCSGKRPFFGFKLYTALGWAPMDPFLRDPLERFYKECERDQIPLLNHCTPAGYYTHDRRFYYDLLLEEEKLHGSARIAPGRADHVQDGWMSLFAQEVPGPNSPWLNPRTTSEKVWWFTHHYVSAHAWRKVIARFPRLKICLAHLGDSDHLSDRKWSVRKPREPHRKGAENLTIEFDNNGHVDLTGTHRFLYDLIDLVTPENRVFIDLSYVILDEHNSSKFMELFAWAREHKPVLLERILWGTDWPLVGNEDPVKHLKSGNMLQRYAQGFRDAVPDMPNDFFLRACFLNPLQYLDLKRIRKKLGGTAGWNWVEDMDPRHFSMDFTDDKVELLYRTNKQLHKQLA